MQGQIVASSRPVVISQAHRISRAVLSRPKLASVFSVGHVVCIRL